MADAFVLIVEDELEIGELVEFHVRREGCDARLVASGRTALEQIRKTSPDLVILDLMLPDMAGLEVLRRLKQDAKTRDVPVVIVSARGEETDVVAGIELGAEDYVTKPFSPRVLMARVKNVLRRREMLEEEKSAGEPRPMTLLGGSLMIDPARHVVECDGRPIDLTLTEFGMLQYLASRPGFVRTREQIISAVHGKATVLSSRTVDVHVTALRRKLGAMAECIETVRGVGYRFAETVEHAGSDRD